METQELANLIFPEVKEISYYEEKYKKRDLKERRSCDTLCAKPDGIYAHWRTVSSIGGKKNGKSNRWRVFCEN